MPPPKRPFVPRPAPAPPPPKKKPVPLFAALGAGAVAVIGITAIVLLNRPPEAPPEKKTTGKRVEPEYSLRWHNQDLGRMRKVTVLVTSNVRIKPEDFQLVDADEKTYAPEKADATVHFFAEVQKNPDALAIAFRPASGAAALDLRVPGGKKHPVYRRPANEAFKPFDAPVTYESWRITASGKFFDAATLDLEIAAKPAVDNPTALVPERFFLITDQGDTVTPEVRGRDPFRLRYKDIPKPAKELRLQTDFRSQGLEFLALPVKSAGASSNETVVKPVDLPPKEDLRAAFEAKMSDPLAAFKFLADKPADKAGPIARFAMARVINEDLAAGLKAFQENKADLVERHFTRAALLAEPYGAEFSRQLMRMLFLLKQPRKISTGCSSCKGLGASTCGSCRSGLALGDCPRCDAQGKAACILCGGAGALDHHGYKGTIVIKVEKLYKFEIIYNGKRRQATMDLQTVTYQMSPCEGAGSFQIDFESVNTATGVKSPGSDRKTCEEFWLEMKRNVIAGKASIQVPNKEGSLVPYSVPAARRFFADYETCKGGKVRCDRCGGNKLDTCIVCSGKGKAMLLCASCEGTAQIACPTCKGYGDASWLARILPAAPILSQKLAEHAIAIRDALDARALQASRREDLGRRLQEAKKGLDPSAKVGPDFVNVTCAKCNGAGGECGECLGAGRREYFEGTPQYERYALTQRLERQIAEVSSSKPLEGLAFAPVPEFDPAPHSESSPIVILDTKRPSASGGTLASIPKAVQDMVRQADALYESGRAHLETAKSTRDQNTWMNEAAQALKDLKNAQAAYAAAQEKLDEMGVAVPKELSDKFHLNTQALYMARKTAP